MRCTILMVLAAILMTHQLSLAESDQHSVPREVEIGVIAGLTGDYSPVFQNWVNGISLAHEVHENSGNFPKVRLLIEDDELSSSKGLSAYRKLVEVNNIAALMNGSSSTMGAISPLVKRTMIPVIQLGEETDEPANDNILQIMPGNIEMEKALGKHLSQRHSKNLVMFYTLHPTMLRFVKAFELGYGNSVQKFEMDPALTDLKPLILKALKQEPSCIVILAFPAQGALLVRGIRQLSEKEIPLAFDGNFQSGIADYNRLLGNIEFLDRHTVVVLSSDTKPAFKIQYQERYGEDPGTMADIGFDAFSLLIRTYAQNSSDWLSNLKKAHFEGASGEVVFDKHGIRKPHFAIMSIGSYRRLKSSE